MWFGLAERWAVMRVGKGGSGSPGSHRVEPVAPVYCCIAFKVLRKFVIHRSAGRGRCGHEGSCDEQREARKSRWRRSFDSGRCALMYPPFPEDEPARQRAVDASGITRRPGNPALQRIVEQAASLAGAPIAAVSVIDRSRQWFAAKVGIDESEKPRSESFCAFAILRPGEPLIVCDAMRDPRFAQNPAVLGVPHVRFYAGIPLVDRSGYALGALCVADTQPRRDDFDVYDLTHLAREAERLMQQ